MISKRTFYQRIEYVVLNKSMTYIDAILYLCEELQIEPTDVKPYISGAILTKIEAEARQSNQLKGGNTSSVLPI